MGEKEGSGVNNRRFRCGWCARRDDAQNVFSVSALNASKAEMFRALLSPKGNLSRWRLRDFPVRLLLTVTKTNRDVLRHGRTFNR